MFLKIPIGHPEMLEKKVYLDLHLSFIYKIRNLNDSSECEQLNSTISNIKTLNKKYLFTKLNNMLKNVNTVCYRIVELENYIIQDYFNLIQNFTQRT